jgi:hypothetical protein
VLGNLIKIEAVARPPLLFEKTFEKEGRLKLHYFFLDTPNFLMADSHYPQTLSLTAMELLVKKKPPFVKGSS